MYLLISSSAEAYPMMHFTFSFRMHRSISMIESSDRDELSIMMLFSISSWMRLFLTLLTHTRIKAIRMPM